MLGTIICLGLIYLCCAAIVTNIVKDIFPWERKLTKPLWVRVVMIVAAPVTIACGFVYMWSALVFGVFYEAFVGTKSASNGHQNMHDYDDEQYLEAEE